MEDNQALIKREERKSPAGAQQGHQHRGHLETPSAQERRCGEKSENTACSDSQVTRRVASRDYPQSPPAQERTRLNLRGDASS